jgi:nucleotide-binding universal stress UspA family protein
MAEKEEADLIVMATHGRSGLSGLIFGSVAEKVVRTATCAVLTIRAQPDGQAPDAT